MAAGRFAYDVEKLLDKEAVNFVIIQLKKRFPNATEPVQYLVSRWGRDLNSLGCYSCDLVWKPEGCEELTIVLVYFWKLLLILALVPSIGDNSFYELKFTTGFNGSCMINGFCCSVLASCASLWCISLVLLFGTSCGCSGFSMPLFGNACGCSGCLLLFGMLLFSNACGCLGKCMRSFSQAKVIAVDQLRVHEQTSCCKLSVDIQL